MSEHQTPLTYEGILEMFRESREQFRESREQFRETDLKFQETDRMVKETTQQMKETDRKFNQMVEETKARMKKTDKQIAALGSKIGRIVESMVRGHIVEKFQAFGYEITQYAREVHFGNKKLGIRGEIDLFLDNGDVAILIEVKTTLETADVRKHIERLMKYRRCADAKEGGDKKRFIGAVAGGVVMGEAENFALENGLYVIVQSGKAVEIITPPEGFVAKEW